MDVTAAVRGAMILQAVLAKYKDSTIEVDTAVMVNKAEQVAQAIAKMERTFGELQRIVTGTNGYWKGEAADHHRKMFYDERENTQKILNRLKEHPSDLKLMAEGYNSTQIKLTEENQRLQNDYI